MIGQLLAALALVCQIVFGSVVPAQAAQRAPSLDTFPICHSGETDGSDSGVPADHAHGDMQCALCPACHTLAAAAVVPTPASIPARTPILAGRYATTPPARAPPGKAVLAATYPTGPPRLA